MEKSITRWIDIMCDFLQGDNYSPVGFYTSEILICKLLLESRGYGMGQPGKRSEKHTCSLFVDDLKVKQEES